MEQTGISAAVYAFCFVYGACIFSFLNVVIYRLPRHLPFWKGRSKCTSCGHVLGAADMIPVFGWLLLRGRCRYCGARFSGRYAAVELLGGVLGCLACQKYGLTLDALTAFAFLAVLTAAAFVDWDTMEIPNGFVLAAALTGCVSLAVGMEPAWPSRLAGVFCVSVPMLILACLIAGAFGGGDIKLAAACGLMLGWRLELLAVFLAILGGGGYGIYLLLTGKAKRDSHFAFGPFLSLGMGAALLWGEPVLAWYLSLLR